MGYSLRRVLVILSLSVLAGLPATAQADTLELVGQSSLGGTGLNGQVATVGNIAVVGSGILGGAGARNSYYATYPCPATTVKIVDVSTPSAPVVRSEIAIQPLAVPNDVAALRVNTPSFNGVLLAVALVRCQNSVAGNATERGVAYYDITDPANPVFMSRFNPDENFFFTTDPPCSLATSTRCASSNDNVSLVERPDGKILSLSTEPFSSNSQPRNIRPECGTTPAFPAECKYRGDVRIVDVTNPSTPTFVGSYPNAAELNGGVEQRPPGYTPPGGTAQPVSTSNNGCRNFNAALSVGVQNGNRALVPYLDAGLLTVDITNPAAPSTLGRWAYPTDRAVEGNAAYVDPASAGGRDLALVGENDWIAPRSSLRIDNGSVAGSKFACEASFTLFDPEDTAQVYRKPNSQVPGGIVYVGRACPGDPLSADLSGVAGKIAFKDRIRVADREPAVGTNCSVGAAVSRLQAAGALGVVIGNASTVAPQAVTLDGNPTEGPVDLTIPVSMIDTGDAVALRNALCPAVAGGVGGCGPGGEVLSGAMVDSPGEWGNLKVIDVTDPAAPALRGTYTPPPAKVFPPPDLGVYAVHHAVARGSKAFVAGHSNGLRALDLTSADPTELDAFVPPDRTDPTGSIPAKANVVGVDVAANGAIVISDINSGLYVLRLNPPASPPPPPAPPAPPPPAAAGLSTAKLSLARATINRRDRVLDVLAPITSLASGRVNVELHAAGRRFRFTAPVDSRNGRIRFRQRIPAAQARLGTGILTISYRGDADTRPQTVRLRAANGKAELRLARPTIAANGRLRASGTVSSRARGVVRVQMEYVADGQTRTRQYLARISNGRWSLNQALSPAISAEIGRRVGTVHSYTLFTGYLPARMRGEMRSFQVLGPR